MAIIRTLSTQRTVSLYKDQEERIEKIIKFRTEITIADIVRKGVDYVLDELEKEIYSPKMPRSNRILKVTHRDE